MSTLATKGNWNIAKGKLTQKIAQLTDEELQFFDGEEELTGHLHKRVGQPRGKIKHLRDEVEEYHGSHH